MKKISLLFSALAMMALQNQAQTVKDIDGNVYNTVTIGTQTWMKENLKVTRYRNGDTIPNMTDNTSWSNTQKGAWCYYSNDSTNNVLYGKLYNWYAVSDSIGLCPAGFHVPAKAEWDTLLNYVGGSSIAGGKLKYNDTIYWNSPNLGATNESGFTALPGGCRFFNAPFSNIKNLAAFWSGTLASAYFPWSYLMYNSTAGVTNSGGYNSKFGFSVRCIKDIATGINNNDFENKQNFYPNPASDRIFIDLQESRNSNVSIYNLVGELVLQKQLVNAKNEIDISNLSKGIYIIKMSSVHGTVQQKLFKE